MDENKPRDPKEEKEKLEAEKKRKKQTIRLCLWGIAVIVVVVLSNFKPSFGMTKAEENTDDTTKVFQPYTKEVTGSTTWYAPGGNARLHVWAEIKENGIWWQMRTDHNDNEVIDLPPNEYPPIHVALKKNADIIEYRVKPGQQIDHCTFVFHFSPFRD